MPATAQRCRDGTVGRGDVPRELLIAIAAVLLNGQSVRFAPGQTPDPLQLVRFTGSL